MKKIIPLLLLATITTFTACEKPAEIVSPLEVNYINTDGTWQLSEWNDAPLAEGTWLYIVLDRKSHTFKVYDNLSSMYPHLSTGTFEITNDWRIGDIISGTYDHGNGAWGHEYIVTDLYKESMIWTAKDNATDKQKFVRVAEVPTQIIEDVRQTKN